MAENENAATTTEATGNVERRKTAHLTEGFKQFNAVELGLALGTELTEDQAYTIFKLCQKMPLRFLATLPDEEADSDGDFSVPLPGIGRFMLRNTAASGKKAEIVTDGKYPRYKFYPTTAIEVEVENMYGIKDPEYAGAYEKMRESETKAIDKLIKQMKKKFVTEGETVVTGNGKSKPASLEDMIKGLVRNEVNSILDSAGSDPAEPEKVQPAPAVEPGQPAHAAPAEPKATGKKQVASPVAEAAQSASAEPAAEVTPDAPKAEGGGSTEFNFDFE